MPAHPIEQGELTSEESPCDSHLVATLEIGRWWELNRAVAFALFKVADHLVRHLRRLCAIQHKPQHTRAPSGRVPLQLNPYEGTAREQG
jgi:hypothetical protein